MESATNDNGVLLQPRGYQLEMLRASLEQNIIVAMDTGSGKTNIAVLRIDAELKRCSPGKLVWFLCPTVALAQQQQRVLKVQRPAAQSVLLSGSDGMDHWSSQSIWDQVLENINIVVSTHQVLFDAMTHGFIRIQRLALLVYDEAHHCARNHPANLIMQIFYHPAKQKGESVPFILGLTASPVISRKSAVKSLPTIEHNLDSISRTPTLHRDEMLKYVHQPLLKELVYSSHLNSFSSLAPSLRQLIELTRNLDIMQDPYVIKLLADGHEATSSRLQDAVMNRRTQCCQQLQHLIVTAMEVQSELGSWACEVYMLLCAQKLRSRRQSEFFSISVDGFNVDEKEYLARMIQTLQISSAILSKPPDDRELTPKVRLLINTLANEMHHKFAGIVFVKTRVSVKLLCILLSSHLKTKDILELGSFVGTSNSSKRKTNIADIVDIGDQNENLEDLRRGNKNLIICTSVCEEGIDITACNMVICFEPPPNLKSFVQRRGRARSAQSQYIIMFEGNASARAATWQELEDEMKELYMDEMRQLQEYQHLEAAEWGYKEFEVESTGAKITLTDSVSHLHHFCATLPQTRFAALTPIFEYREMKDDGFYGIVTLPNSVDASVREFRSAQPWRTQRLAKMDAAFEAYVGLYRAGLINQQLLPSIELDADTTRVLSEIETRPGVVVVNEILNPWTAVARAWQTKTIVRQHTIRCTRNGREELIMNMLSPIGLPMLGKLVLHVNATHTIALEVGDGQEVSCQMSDIILANEITKVLLQSMFGSKMNGEALGFPLLFIPVGDTGFLRSWLQEVKESYAASDLLAGVEDVTTIGIIRDSLGSGRPHIFHGIEHRLQPLPGCQTEGEIQQLLRTKKFSRRTDFMHVVPHGEPGKGEEFLYLEPKQCRVERLPVAYARFASFIPSIMHHIGKSLVAQDLCQSVLEPVKFSSLDLVIQSISTTVAREVSNYQRLEFLGDSVLGFCTSLALMAEHLNWHESLLAKAKDHVVNNARLASATRKTGLDKYILTKSFTGSKWRPKYNDDLVDASRVEGSRELSTKTLADVVEALLGAAYVSGSFQAVLTALEVMLPVVDWRPIPNQVSVLVAATDSAISLPAYFKHIGQLTGHTFTHPSLLLDALCHPSYLSVTRVSSYQRLEFLGDAILSIIVTRIIYAHAPKLAVPRMHLLRSAAVNGHFLAFLAMELTVSVPISKIVTPNAHHPEPLDGAYTITHNHEDLALYHFLLHSADLIFLAARDASASRHGQYRSQIVSSLTSGDTYPWTALAMFAPEKFFSDIVESTLGAIYIDTEGDFNACEAFLERLGVLPFLRRAMAQGVKVWHPKEELGVLAGNEKVRYELFGQKKKGDGVAAAVPLDVDAEQESQTEQGISSVSCRVFIGERLISTMSGREKLEAQTKAAEAAIEILKQERSTGADDRMVDESTDQSLAPVADDDDDEIEVKEGGNEDDAHDDEDDDHDDEDDDPRGLVTTGICCGQETRQEEMILNMMEGVDHHNHDPVDAEGVEDRKSSCTMQ